MIVKTPNRLGTLMILKTQIILETLTIQETLMIVKTFTIPGVDLGNYITSFQTTKMLSGGGIRLSFP